MSDKKKAYRKQYRIDNADKLREYRNKKNQCDCGGSYANKRKAEHMRTNKHKEYILFYNVNKRKAYQKQYRIDNADKLKEREKQYYKDNADKIRERKKQYYKDNADKIREQRKQYRIDNADKIKERKKQYRIDNADKCREYSKKYYQNNADKLKAYKNKKNDCQCGGRYTTKHKAQHMNSKKHKEYILCSKDKDNNNNIIITDII